MARPWQETIPRDEFDTLLGRSDSLRNTHTTVERGALADVCVTRGYLSVLQRAASH